MEKANKFEPICSNKIKDSGLEPEKINKAKLKLLTFDGEALSAFTHSDIQSKSYLLKNLASHIINQPKSKNFSIIDINEQFKGKEINQIIMEIAKIFNWDTLDISKSYISSSDIQHEKFNLPSDEICFDNIDHEIISRPKYQKLTKDQLFYLKSIIDTSKLSISEISCKYYIWPTTLRKIKHLSFEELGHHPIKNF